MRNETNRRNVEAVPRDAPDVGAFYFEDALAVLAQSGFRAGRVDFTLPPGQSDKAAALARACNNRNGGGSDADLSALLPPMKFRVLKCSIRGNDPSGTPICDLLVTTAAEPPIWNAADEP